MFIFLSTQFIINHSNACDVFIECSHRTTLHVLALDEVHFHVQHRMLFCRFVHSKPFFCKNIWEPTAHDETHLIALTATMPTSYLPLLSKLLTINSFSGDSLVRLTQNKFAQQEIEIWSYVASNKGQYISKGLTLVSQFLRDNPSASAVIFCNSLKQLQHLCDRLEHKLNELKLNVDVMHINGTLHKMDKFWRI